MSFKGFVEGGGEVIELTDEEMQQWKDACAPIYKDPQFASVMEMYNRIQKEIHP